jgi:hypothetical protein
MEQAETPKSPPVPRETLVCPCDPPCGPCNCGSTDLSCLCWCAHDDATPCDHPFMVTLKGSRYAGVAVLGKMLKPDGRFLSAPYPVALTYANRTQANRAKEKVEAKFQITAWVMGNRPFYVRVF